MSVARESLESDAVHAFGVFAEHLNFTAAARELHLSQPSLHVKVRKLQAALGVDLYVREGRGLRLTAAGQRVAAFARDAGRRADDLLAVLGGAGMPIAIAAGRGTLRWVIGEGIGRLVASGRTPTVLTADRDAALAALEGGRVDLAVIAHDAPPRPLRSAQLATFPQVLIVPADDALAARADVTLTDLDGVRLVVPPAARPHRRALERALLDAGARWTIAAEVDGWDLMTHFTSLGLGAAVVNGCVTPPAGTVAVPVRDLPAVRYWGAWRPERDDVVRDALALLRGDR